MQVRGREQVMVRYTVLVPVRDATEGLSAGLAHLADQMERLVLPYEIICILDATSADLLRAVSARPLRLGTIRVLRFDPPRGTSAAFAAGVAAARGEVIVGMSELSPERVADVPHLISRLGRADLAIAHVEKSIGARLSRAWQRVRGRRNTSAGELSFAANRIALAELSQTHKAFHALAPLAAHRGLRVCQVLMAAGLPPRGEHFRPGLVDRLRAGWIDRRFTPHLAREIAQPAGPKLGIPSETASRSALQPAHCGPADRAASRRVTRPSRTSTRN